MFIFFCFIIYCHQVNLFSELPKPSPVVQSGLNFNPSKLVTLDFPRAQRVELHSDSPQANEQGAHKGLLLLFLLFDDLHLIIKNQ